MVRTREDVDSPKEEESKEINEEVSQGKIQIVEREINLSLINDKLNYIISCLNK